MSGLGRRRRHDGNRPARSRSVVGSAADVTGVGSIAVVGAAAINSGDVVAADGSAVSLLFGSAIAAPTPPSAMQMATQ